MDLITKIKGLNTVGWSNVFQAVQYGFRKKKIESSTVKEIKRDSKVVQKIGVLKNHISLENGFELQFENAIAEILVLADNMVRVTWTPGKIPVPYTIEKETWSKVDVIHEEQDGYKLKTDKLLVKVDKSGAVSFKDNDVVLRKDNPPSRVGSGWCHEAELKDSEHIFGLGQRNHALNLRGGSYLMWNEEPMGDYGEGSDPIYVCIPAYIGLHEDGNYLVYFENSNKGTVEFKETATAKFYQGALRYYFISGSVKETMDRFSELTGRPALPPKWALGYHQTRWSYKTEEETMEVANGFKENNLPISVIHLDIHYMDGYRVFTVDKSRFPDLKRLSSNLDEMGIKTVTILDPGVKADPEFELYKDANKKGLFCKLPDGKNIEGPVWPGWCGFPDFTNPEARKWWGGHYRKLLDLGVDGFWHDMNEPAVFSSSGQPTLPLNTMHDMEGRGGNHIEAHNLYGLLENRAAFEGIQKSQPEKRPWMLTRSGYASMQRYAWNWTGDTGCNWWSVKHNLKLAIMLGLSGVPYTGSDIGGFNGDPSAELYIRWFQMSSFMPFFRTHSAAFVKRREPWSFGQEITDIARKYLELRYKLMPYWYTLAWEASETGCPLVRPLWWLNSKDQRLWDIEDQFMLGDSIMVAPILEQGAKSRKVVLPEGKWMSFWDHTWHEGFAEIEVKAELDSLPIFVRAGSLIPMEIENNLCLQIFLNKEMSTAGCRVYSDADDGYGSYRVDSFELKYSDNTFELTREESGDFDFSYNEIDLDLVGCSVAKVVVDGKQIDGLENIKTKPFRKCQISIK